MNKYCVLALFLAMLPDMLPAQKAAAQRRDTIFVYDTIFVTDTIRIAQPLLLKKGALETLPCRNAGAWNPEKIMVISECGTATILPKDIIDSNNIVHLPFPESMNKASFFAVVWFAFQHMVSAQNTFYLSAGGGAYQMVDNHNTRSDAAPLFSAGVGYRRTFGNSHLSLGTELRFHLMRRSDFDSVLINSGLPQPLNLGADYTRNPFMFSVPLTLRWQGQMLSPVLGAEYYYKLSPQQGPVAISATEWETQQYRTPYNGLSLLGGFDLPISSRLQASISYCHGLLPERSVSYNGVQYRSKMRRLELQLQYRIK